MNGIPHLVLTVITMRSALEDNRSQSAQDTGEDMLILPKLLNESTGMPELEAIIQIFSTLRVELKGTQEISVTSELLLLTRSTKR